MMPMTLPKQFAAFAVWLSYAMAMLIIIPSDAHRRGLRLWAPAEKLVWEPLPLPSGAFPAWFPRGRAVPGIPLSPRPPRCYLDAVGGEEGDDILCPVCWETPSSPAMRAQIVNCPPGFELAWIDAPPKQLTSGNEYNVSYRVHIGDQLDRLEPIQGFEISHANIHSCFASVKECTPSIAATPGLATHTDAQKDNVNFRGNAEFVSKISELPPGEYTVIAHVRFFFDSETGNDGSKEINGGTGDSLKQYDAAIGLRRTVVGPTVPPALPLPSDPPPRCYLDAVGGEEGDDILCPVCWETPSSPAMRAQIVNCPPGFELAWIDAPPKQLTSGNEYNVSYRVHIGDQLDRLEPIQGFEISHANIHSCFASVKECTPSIAATPGLATHTDAQEDNVNFRGNAEFVSKISELPPGEYMVIAHVRFFFDSETGNDGSQEINGGTGDSLKQYDAAIGLRRTVSPDT